MEIARSWRLQGERLRLEGAVCTSCGLKALPAPRRCGACGGTELTAYRFSGRGEVYSVTEVHEAPPGFDSQVPYLMALVQLEEGPLVVAGLTDVELAEAAIGLPVEMVTRRIREDGLDGLITYGYKFRPRLLG